MFSKPAAPAAGGRPSQGAPTASWRLTRAAAQEVLARAAAAWGPAAQGGGCLGARSLADWAAAGAPPAAPAIATTVSSRASRIRTTVAERRSRLEQPVGAACSTATATATAAVGRRSDAEAPAAGGDREADGDAPRKVEASKLAAFAKAAAEVLDGPQLMLLGAQLAGPLQLLSPWSGLAGAAGAVAMAAPPPCGMPPLPTQAQRVMMMNNMQGMQQEEEQFAALIFPGFDSDAFIWQVTCLQVAEFVFSMVMGHQRANPTPCVLYRLGASWGPAITRGAVWRLIAPVMLHANLTHLLFNVFFQLRMGFGMEKQFGRGKMMAIYFACGLFGNLISVTLDPYKLAVGASTAGFGLIGVWLAEILLSWEVLGPARERTIIWIVFMLISVTTMSSMTPNMDLYGHLGGALGGFLLSIVISDMREQDRPEWYGQARAAAAVGLALILTGSLSKVMLFSPRDPLPDCPALLHAVIPSLLHGATTAATRS